MGSYSATVRSWVELSDGRQPRPIAINGEYFTIAEPIDITFGTAGVLVVEVDGQQHRLKIRVAGWEVRANGLVLVRYEQTD